MIPVSTAAMSLTAVKGEDDPSVNWAGAYASYGGSGSDLSSTVYFAIEPGGHLGWHTDSTEETQFIIAGEGEIRRPEGAWPVSAGSVFVLPENVRHDLVNTGSEPLRGIAFFSAPVVTQHFDNILVPPGGHVLGSPNAAA